MYIWDIDGLVSTLSKHDISDKKARYYYLIYAITLIFYAKLYYLFFYWGNEGRPVFTIFELFWIVLSVVAWALCYFINRKGDDKHFVKRMVCLAVPIAVRTAVYILFPVIATLLLIRLMTGQDVFYQIMVEIGYVWPVIATLIFMYFYVTYYGMLAEAIKKVSQAR